MTLRRYHIKCRICNGRGFIDEGVDDDDQGHRVKCKCYRGIITILLAPEDEVQLLSQLKTATA